MYLQFECTVYTLSDFPLNLVHFRQFFLLKQRGFQSGPWSTVHFNRLSTLSRVHFKRVALYFPALGSDGLYHEVDDLGNLYPHRIF